MFAAHCCCTHATTNALNALSPQSRQAEYESKCKALEQGFALRVPQPLPPALARALNPEGSVGSGSSVNGAAGRGGRGVGVKAASAGARPGGLTEGASYKCVHRASCGPVCCVGCSVLAHVPASAAHPLQSAV